MDWGSRRLWTLFDMIRFHASAFFGVAEIMAALQAASKLTNVKPDLPTRVAALQETVRLLRVHRPSIGAVGMRMSLISLDHMAGRLAEGSLISHAELYDLTTELLERMRDELDGMMIWHIPDAHTAFFKADLFGSGVTVAFPSAEMDIAEAGRCFALDRYPACVFHLMRTAERALRVIAGDLKVPLASEKKGRSWGGAIHDINSVLSAMPDMAPKKIKYREPMLFLAEVKDLWRDKGIHPVEDFSPEKTERVYYAIKSFMATCAEHDIAENFDEESS